MIFQVYLKTIALRKNITKLLNIDISFVFKKVITKFLINSLFYIKHNKI